MPNDSDESPTSSGRSRSGPATGLVVLAGALVVVGLVLAGWHLLKGPPVASAGTPSFSVCSWDAPQVRPSHLYWCTSECSTYVDQISWATWGPTEAVGYGVEVTNDGIPNCAQGTRTPHANFRVVLDDPRWVSYCQGSTPVKRWLYTRANLWGNPWTSHLPVSGATCS